MSDPKRAAPKNSRKRGCPTCAGVDPKSCMRCYGKTLLRDWWHGPTGWQWGNFKDEPPAGREVVDG